MGLAGAVGAAAPPQYGIVYHGGTVMGGTPKAREEVWRAVGVCGVSGWAGAPHRICHRPRPVLHAAPPRAPTQPSITMSNVQLAMTQ